MRYPILRWTAFLIILFVLVGRAEAAFQDEDIPSALQDWRAWVLYGHEAELCPPQFNDGTTTRCQWPALLKLDLTFESGVFEQRWLVLSRSWVALPGSRDIWPDAVSANGQAVAVIERNGRPMVELQAGDYRISGRFFWQQLPQTLDVPTALGLLSLTLNGLETDPVLDAQGRLWLQKSVSGENAGEQLTVRIFRRLQDTIPMQVETLVRLEAAGKHREVVLEDILLPTSVPMNVSSRLPARIDPNGKLVVQVRPGRWEISIATRIPGPVQRLATGPMPHGDEIWSFEPHHELRMVEIEGVTPIEPSQTEMPAAWRHLSAYLVKASEPMLFKETRRGDDQPAPDHLNLQRTWWLDMDGGGFTIHDQISGTLSRQWSLAMNPPMTLGRVAVNGLDRVITQQGPENQIGVELRHGHLQLEADARLPKRSGSIPALGWGHDFQKVGALLHLPPGWKLLAALGVDAASDTWLERWSLLDFFIVLIIALAVFKLRSWRWSLIALAAMALIYHEPGAPRLVWLHLLAILALVPLLPANWFRKLLILWGVAAGVYLLVITVPFIVKQVRWGMYPQLGPASHAIYPQRSRSDLGRLVLKEKQLKEALPAQAPSAFVQKALPEPKAMRSSMEQVQDRQYDPDALISTGPGLPDWQWRTIRLTWNGPVAREQTMRLILLSPWINFLLALLRVGLLAALIWGIMDWRSWWQKLRHHVHWPILILGACLAVGNGPVRAQAADQGEAFPPPPLLDTLRERLLQKPDCLPQCADISRMELSVDENQVQLILKVHAALNIAVPLPVARTSWQPQQVFLDNAPISGLARDNSGQLWAMVPAGSHTLVLSGHAGREGLIQVPLPLRPHRVSVKAEGWAVKGVRADGTPDASIELARLQGEKAQGDLIQRGAALPPFLEVKRLLQLGLTWQMTTTVTRLTPPGAPVVVSLPLLADESITTAGFQVDQGAVLINLSADQQTTSFDSTLPIKPAIRLTAAQTVPWTEIWILDAGPMWHCDLEGIPVIHHQDKKGLWRPQWRPWPGEKVTIHVQRPKAVVGQVLTVDAAELVLTPGQRVAKGDLKVNIRTSRGGQLAVELPAKANLQSIDVNGRSLPIRQDGSFVGVPLQPGTQTVHIQWNQLTSFSAWFKSPLVKIGQKAINAHISIKMPPERWILMTGGPRWGPAILFWSYLAVIILAALALGRIPLTPLKPWAWLLLGLGLTQIPPAMALIIVGWLLALGLRERRPMAGSGPAFNAVQIGLVAWTLAALVCMFFAVEAGLAGQPAMQIAGNQSHAGLLNWFQDHFDDSLPQVWVFSLPVWVYSMLMLVWSLWLAFSLLGWLKWGWRCFSKAGLWRKIELPKRKKPSTSAPEAESL